MYHSTREEKGSRRLQLVKGDLQATKKLLCDREREMEAEMDEPRSVYKAQMQSGCLQESQQTLILSFFSPFQACPSQASS